MKAIFLKSRLAEDSGETDPTKMVMNYSEFIGAAINLRKYLNEEKLWSLFRYFDHTEQGYFTIENIRSAIAREGRKLPESELEDMLKELNMEKNAKITFEKFKELMKGDLQEEDIDKIASSLLSNDESSYT